MAITDAASAERAAWSECGAMPHQVDDILAAGGYGAILDAKDKHLEWQDTLDSVLQARLLAVRDAVREVGYTGEPYKPLVTVVGDTTLFLRHTHQRVGAGNNLVSTTFEIYDPEGKRALHSVLDRVDRPARDFARALHAGALQSMGVEPVDSAEAAAQIHALLQQAQGLWARLPKDVREELADANYPGTPLAELIDQGVAAAQEVVEHIAAPMARPRG